MEFDEQYNIWKELKKIIQDTEKYYNSLSKALKEMEEKIEKELQNIKKTISN
jgi:uncharacterized protein Yka (UPF0111/DUF47 family)